MKNSVVPLIIFCHVTFCSIAVIAQDHGHLHIGALGTNQNDPLIFENDDAFASDSDYVKTLDFASSGTYTGYYAGNITFAVLAATPAHLGPVPNAPALGSVIFSQLTSVTGPPDGEFAFWESGATSPTYSLKNGQTGTNIWQLSENDGSPGTDPFGHVHGRRFTASKPGIYTVGFRVFDLSTNGFGSDPIHTPSAELKINFQAGVNFKSLQVNPVTNLKRITFGARAGFIWQVEAADFLFSDVEWEPVGEPVIGDDHFHDVEDSTALKTERFYRLNGAPFIP